MPNVGPTEFKVVCAIARKTFGWWKDYDQLSRSQLCKMTGLSQATVKRAIKSLEDGGWIAREPGTSRSLPEYAVIYNTRGGSNLSTPPGQIDPPPPGQIDPPQNTLKYNINTKEFAEPPTGVLPKPKQDIRQQGFPEPEYLPAIGPAEYKKTCAAFDNAQETATGKGISGAAWGKEGSALKALLKAHSHDEIRQQLARLAELRRSDKIFWQTVPLTPSSLRSRWDAINAEKTAGVKAVCQTCNGTGIEISTRWQDSSDGWKKISAFRYERKCICQNKK